MKVLVVIAAVFCVLAVTAGATHNYFVRRLGRIQTVLLRVPLKDVVKPRIINGTPATLGQFPHQAALNIGAEDGTSILCGGSLITSSLVLTAAHCLTEALTCDVLLGSVTLNGSTSRSVVIRANKAFYHSSYDPATGENDISILGLSSPAPINYYIQPIALNNEFIAGDQALVVSGFGKVFDACDANKRLIYAKVHSIENGDCNTYYDGGVPDTDICAVGYNGESACNGDSGGPLILHSDAGDSIVGIVSFGRSDGCENGAPVAYTRISDHYDFIQEIIGLQ